MRQSDALTVMDGFMDEEVLFQITRGQLESGLRGVPVGYCVTSLVHPDKGLFYVDHPIRELAFWEPERVIFLLYHGKEGSARELEDFSTELKQRAPLHPGAVEQIRQLPKFGKPMDLFSTALLISAMFEEKGDYREDCLNLIAKIPQIAAIVINHHAGWGEGKPSQPELGYMENFAQMLNRPQGSNENLTYVLKLFNILHYDHGGGNLSVFVGKAVASGLEGMYGSISAAMNALAGPRHGWANQGGLSLVKEVEQRMGDEPQLPQLKEYIQEKVDRRELIYGFGHAVLRVEDPRAAIFYDYAEKHFGDKGLVKAALLLRQVVPEVLKNNPHINDPYANVDAVSGTVLTAAGFPYPEYYTVLFGMSRIVGISIQIVYERLEARGGKGTPLVRPKYLFHHRRTAMR